ncbi:podocan-like protein 1 [Neosynchiropus ocellatus]
MEEDGLTPEVGRSDPETRGYSEVHPDWRRKGARENQKKMKPARASEDTGTLVFQEERLRRLVAGLHLQDLSAGGSVDRVLSTFTARLETQPTQTPPPERLYHPDGRVTATPLSDGSTSSSAKVTPAEPTRWLIQDLLPELLHSPEHREERTGHAPMTTAEPQTSETVDQPGVEEPTATQNSRDSDTRPTSVTLVTRAEDRTRVALVSPLVTSGSQTQKVKAGSQTDGRIQRTSKATFPFFTDDYCPPDCSCYGRVVQCSDRRLDKVPYGIPYNARYILLMNNRIDGIQLDLLKGYTSLEFLVLSNNRLTDGAIKGAFEGVPALKRLFLDRNLLASVPADLPASLEELRLEGNQLRVMSEAAWTRCPGLLVLSLNNNSLGSGSGSLPKGVLRPLTRLRALNLDHNQLSSVPLGLPLSIKELYLRGNLIREFRRAVFGGVSPLVLLDLSSNRLTNKGLPREALFNTTHLESLNLEGNRLKQVPPHLPQSLKTLNLEGNLIWSVNRKSFRHLKNLEHLSLSRNKIVKVVPGAFKSLSALHQLDLCYNALRQVPRQLPPGLHSLTLTHNQIDTVSPDAFCWGNVSVSGLIQVRLEQNLIQMGRLDSKAFRCLRGPQIVRFY